MNFKSKYSKKENYEIDFYNIINKQEYSKALLISNNGNLELKDIPFPIFDSPIPINRPLANVTVDTTFFCNPNTIIDFTGIISTKTMGNAFASTLNFTLFKLYNEDKVPISLTTFSFSISNFFLALDNRILKFKYSTSDNSCKYCCTYILELTSISNSAFEIDRINVTIDGNLSALVVES